MSLATRSNRRVSASSSTSVGLKTPATDQDDLDNYSIGVTFAVL